MGKIRLESCGDYKVKMIKLIREWTGLGLKDAKDIADSVGNGSPVTLNVSDGMEDTIVKQVVELGGKATVVSGSIFSSVKDTSDSVKMENLFMTNMVDEVTTDQFTSPEESVPGNMAIEESIEPQKADMKDAEDSNTSVSSVKKSEENQIQGIHLSAIDTPYGILERERETFANRDTFKFGRSTIQFSRSALFFRRIYDSMTRFIENQKIDFSIYINNELKNARTTESFFNSVEKKAQQGIDSCLEAVVDILICNQILNWDVADIKSGRPNDFIYKRNSRYQSVLDQYNEILDYEKSLNVQKQIERGSRSQWQGGGFGLGGAIKGAINAKMMNMATDAVRGIGDGATDAADSRKIEKAKKDFLSDSVANKLRWGYEDCLDNTLDFLAKQFESRGISSAIVINRFRKDVYNTVSNLSKVNNDQKFEVVKKLVEENPYNTNVINYLLENATSIGVAKREAREIALYMNRVTFDLYSIRDFSLADVNKDSAEMYRKELLERDVIDENNHLTDMEMDSLRRIQLKLLAKLIQVEWEAEADIDENDIDDINKLSVDRVQGTYKALRKVAGRYDILADPLNFELLPEYKDSNNALQELMQNVRKQFQNARTINGITFDTLEEAFHYRRELESFESIYMKGTYADYDSKELEKVIEQLEACGFQHHLIQESLENLREKKNSMEAHEASEDYKKGKELLEIIKNAVDDKFSVYGSENFLRNAKYAVNDKMVRENEALPVPVAIYNAGSSSITGFVLTDRYFYNFNTLLGFIGLDIGNKPICLNDVLRVGLNKKTLVFNMVNGKTIKVKMIDKETLIMNAINEIWCKGTSNVIRNENLEDSKEKIFCPYCGNRILRTAKFCSYCGKENHYGREN